MANVLFLSAPLVERIWGGDYFETTLNLKTEGKTIGEMWSCSCVPGNESIILNPEYDHISLKELYETKPELFNKTNASKAFPILVKLIATSADLSVQVHPDDEYALKYEGQYGKNEGWLVLDSKPGSSIVVGHNATTKGELENYIAKDDYSKLVTKRIVNKGEFYPIPAGTLHALGKGIVVLEVQQSSDVTYRVYDYHRVDKSGKERELHVKKALDVISLKPYDYEINTYDDNDNHTLWSNQYFNVALNHVNNESIFATTDKYVIITAISHGLVLDGTPLPYGSSAIVLPDTEVTILGSGAYVVTSEA